MALSYLFDPNKQFQDKNGVNNVGGYLYVFINDSDDHAPTYCNFTGTLNPERIVLDNNGRAVVIVDELKTYRIEVYDRSGNMLWSQYPVRPTNVIYGDYNVYNADIYGTPDEIDVDVEMSASGVKKFTIKLANAVKTVIGNIQDTISSIVETVSTKADKVQGAPAGNLASLDANGNLANSGKKVTDFKTKQTAVTDPTVDGNGLSFIDSVTQNANGEITPHKKTVQDGTTAQKGVVKLSNAINSTSTTEAATPKAVKDAYDDLNNKIVARAVFLSQAEWSVQSQLPGDPAKVYYVENGTGEDAYTVYVWKESTSEYVEVDESSIDLDGYWHDAPNTTGTGNVVTNITLGNDGVPQVEKGLTALTQHQDISGKLDKTGDASNTTSTFTKASGDTSSMTSGGKLSALFTAISSFFASLKALAFKDKASYSDLSSGVQSSLDKADTALQIHQPVTDNNPTLDWNTTSKVGKVGSTDLRVTMPSNPAQNLPASVITSGTFGTAFIADDAITADKVKDNETLPVNVSGEAGSASVLSVKRILSSSDNIDDLENDDDFVYYHWLQNSIPSGTLPENITTYGYLLCEGHSNRKRQVMCIAGNTQKIYTRQCYARQGSSLFWTPWLALATVPAGGAGSPTTPVYVDSDGQVQPCSTSDMSVGSATKAYVGAYPDGNNYKLTLSYAENANNDLKNTANLRYYHDANNGHFISIGNTSGTGGQTDVGGIRFANGDGTYAYMRGTSYPGNAATATHLSAYGEWNTWNGTYVESTPFANIGEQTWPLTDNNGDGSVLQFEKNNELMVRLKLCIVTSGSTVARVDAILLEGTINIKDVKDNIKITYFTYTSNNTQYIAVRLYVKFTGNWQNWRVRQLDCQTADNGYLNWRPFNFFSGRGSDKSSAVGTPATYSFRSPFAYRQVGSTSTPVYVDSDGQVQPCNPSQMTVGNATKWDGHAISIGEVSSSQGTISIV